MLRPCPSLGGYFLGENENANFLGKNRTKLRIKDINLDVFMNSPQKSRVSNITSLLFYEDSKLEHVKVALSSRGYFVRTTHTSIIVSEYSLEFI